MASRRTPNATYRGGRRFELKVLIEQHLVQAAILAVNQSDGDVIPVAEFRIEGGVPPVHRLARRWQPPTTRAIAAMAVETIAGGGGDG